LKAKRFSQHKYLFIPLIQFLYISSSIEGHLV
jgi:hypothetical protein